MTKIYFLILGVVCSVGINAQIINIPDANFKSKLLQPPNGGGGGYQVAFNALGVGIKVDTNSDGEIQQTEALNVYELKISSSDIVDLTGISYFQNLKELHCQANDIINLDLLGLTNLFYLECNQNPLLTINLTGLTSLNYLACAFTSLPVIDLSPCIALETAYVSNNNFTTFTVYGLQNLKLLGFGSSSLNSISITNCNSIESIYCNFANIDNLDISQLTTLKNIGLGYCNLESIDVSPFQNLVKLLLFGNDLSEINLTGLQNLEELDLSGNQLISLDLSSNINLGANNKAVNLDENHLTSINLKNGSIESTLTFAENPELEFICADENQLVSISDLVMNYGYEGCVVNTYCSFVPGGNIYAVAGNCKFDNENDGCDAADLFIESLKLTVTDTITTGSMIFNASDTYSIPVQAGSHQISPVLENSSYFNISPANATVSFPATASPFEQNFCITPNGTHPDLEISLIPINAATPGLDANYKLQYKNKGTHTQSGSINMSFDDTILDVIDSDPDTFGPSPESLVWSFTDLLPFESRYIYITINLNSPVETPPINAGDILHYTATINSSQTDEMPSDNTFTLNQTVVNSLDPNDKTCLEGNTITPEMVGKYVHYMIRFENTGTANAQNIVVKDMIDITKFDISSLIPLDGSHPFVTRITDTNKVEFIFENIQLPFDDANNDGYVAFKIKTKPTLVVGNTFSNTASIYFDYNAPIVTNTATTAIQVLGTDDFDFNNHFTLYPNPAKDILNIKSKDNIKINSLSVYNTLGQLVLTVTNPMETIDVSELASGNYIIKITSDKGTASSKFIRK